jgi:hypothetical protein
MGMDCLTDFVLDLLRAEIFEIIVIVTDEIIAGAGGERCLQDCGHVSRPRGNEDKVGQCLHQEFIKLAISVKPDLVLQHRPFATRVEGAAPDLELRPKAGRQNYALNGCQPVLELRFD